MLNNNNLLPLNKREHENAGSDGESAYIAGDIRANETVGLTSIHTVFARDHNIWVDHFASHNPNIDATISNEFFTAAFRFCHTNVAKDIIQMGSGSPI